MFLAAGNSLVATRADAKHWHVPLERNPLFTGRDDLLDRLHHLLHSGEARMVALTGLGGIGKTQTAVEYAYRFAATWSSGLFFLRAETRETFLTEYLAIARLLQLPENREAEPTLFERS